jgi:N-acetylmuramoyl-L-alanine amidase
MLKVLSILLFLFSYSLTWAEDKVQVKDIRHYDVSHGLRVVIETTGKVEILKGNLKNPERLFFDLKKASISKDFKKEFVINGSLVSKIRIGQFDNETVRIVFDLVNPGYEFKIISLEDPYRLVIDVYSDKQSKEQKSNDTKVTLKRKIVIDPGHGGKDPGAIGIKGLKEKDVVLDIALKVKDILKSDPQYEIILTRDKDIFIPLNERTEIANKANADLFISIHANASPKVYANGVETYLLNWTDDEEAIRVAARENAISIKKMKKLKGELGFMLASLEREAKRDDSVRLAGYVHNAISSSLQKSFSRHDNGVKQALFYVLVGAQMPSCLLEVSYISNPQEEKLLSEDSYRMQIAESIAEGIKNYFNKSEKIKKVNYAKSNLSKVNTSNKKSTKFSKSRKL